MDAIILAGGFGTRLQKKVPHLPKVLAPIQDKPFLDLLLNQLEGHIEKVILAIGYRAEQIKVQYSSSKVIFSEEKTALGTGGAVKKALSLTGASVVLILNGDSYFDIDFERLIDFHQSKKADLTLACRQVEDTSRYGSVIFDEKGRVTAFFEKSGLKPGWISGGLYLMDKGLLSSFSDEVFSLEYDVFPSILQRRVFVFPSSSKFIDIGTEASYQESQDFNF